MKHKNPGAPLLFMRFGTPRSSEIKRPTINTRREGWTSLKTITDKNTFGLGTPKEKKTHRIFAWVAQLAEQMICNHQVVGSNPIPSSRQINGDIDGRNR